MTGSRPTVSQVAVNANPQLGPDTSMPAQLIVGSPVGDHLRPFYHRAAAQMDASVGFGHPAADPRQIMWSASAPPTARCLRECCVLCGHCPSIV